MGKDGRTDLDFPRRMMPSESADNLRFQSFCERTLEVSTSVYSAPSSLSR